MSCQSRFDARYWMLGAGALGKRAYVRTAAFSAPDPMAATIDPHVCWRLLDTQEFQMSYFKS